MYETVVERVGLITQLHYAVSAMLGSLTNTLLTRTTYLLPLTSVLTAGQARSDLHREAAHLLNAAAVRRDDGARRCPSHGAGLDGRQPLEP